MRPEKRMVIVTTVPLTLHAFMRPIARHFRDQGWRVDAMANGVTAWRPALDEFDHLWEVAWSRHPLAPGNFLRAVARVRDVIASGGYDVVHVHTPVAAFVTRLALAGSTGPRPVLVYTAHGFHFFRGGSPWRNALFMGLEKWAGRWTDHLVVINREDEAAARRLGLVPPERLHPMPGIGVDPAAYSREALPEGAIEGLRAERGLGPGERYFIMVAEFEPRKGHADALAAFAALDRPDVHLVLAGAGSRLEATRALAARLGIAERVHFLGFRTDVASWMAGAAATLLPSRQEGLPRSVMESLSLGVPVIGSDVRGTRDLLESGGGLLVECGAVAELARAMRWVLTHPEEAALMGARGRAAMSGFALDGILARLDGLYEQALSGRATPARTDVPRRRLAGMLPFWSAP